LDCGLLTSRAYWQAKARAGSRMRARHEVLARDVALIRAHRFMAVYGYRKMLMQLRRRGWDGIGRDQVLRVMRSLDIQGARRGRIPAATRPARSRGDREDLVERRFTADAPGRLHVADIAIVALGIREFRLRGVRHRRVRPQDRRLGGIGQPAHACACLGRPGSADRLDGRARRHPGTDPPLGSRRPVISNLYGTHLNEAGILAPTGTVGDSYDNALAESVAGAYKTGLIRRPKPFQTVQALQTATLQWVSW
jgi:putative transposase